MRNKLRITNYALRYTNYVMRITLYELRCTQYVTRKTLSLLKLQFVQLPVFTVLGEKFLVATRFDDASLVHHED